MLDDNQESLVTLC